jgi:hypothetical protein
MAATPEPLIAAWQAEHRAFLRRVRAANRELCAGRETEPLHADYDSETDILLLWFGEPRAALTVDIDNSVSVRVLPDTLQVVGCEVRSLLQAPAPPALAPAFQRARALAMALRDTPDAPPDVVAAHTVLRAILAQLPL